MYQQVESALLVGHLELQILDQVQRIFFDNIPEEILESCLKSSEPGLGESKESESVVRGYIFSVIQPQSGIEKLHSKGCLHWI